MNGKILVGTVIALAIAFCSLAGSNNLIGVNAASAMGWPICQTVTYSAWGNCLNGVATRDVIDKTPVGCSMTDSEQQGATKICGQVLGVKIYGAGTLLRTSNGKIYVVLPGQTIQQIPDLNALQAYAGRKINNVNAAVIAQYKQAYGQVLGVKIYADGTLLRTPDHKIYVIVGGQKQHIHDLAELYQYRNHRIIDVSYRVIADY